MTAPNTKPAHPALMPMAPLVAVAVAEGVLVLEVPVDVNDGVDDETDKVVDGLAAARGAVDSPAISAETDALKVPVIFVRVNWEEKARKAVPLALLPLFDSKRMK